VTINVAWIDDATVYLIADTAVTSKDRSRPRAPSSTFGEPHLDHNERVEEETAKIVEVTPGVAATFSGSLHGALAFLHRLRQRLLLGRLLPDVLEELAVDSWAGSFVILLGAALDDGPRIYRFSTSEGVREYYEQRKPLIEGSLPSEGKQFVRRMCDSIFALGDDFLSVPDRVLAAAVASLQALGQRVDLTRDRAGGTFFGVHVEEHAVSPMQDMLYVLFKSATIRDEIPRIAFVAIRGYVHLAWSTITNQYRAFVTDVRPVLDSEVRALLDHELSLPPEPLVPYYGFIEREVGSMVFIECLRGTPHRSFEIAVKEGSYTLRLKSPLIQCINAMPRATDGRLPDAVPATFLDE
jgi:hypothetical protein